MHVHQPLLEGRKGCYTAAKQGPATLLKTTWNVTARRCLSQPKTPQDRADHRKMLAETDKKATKQVLGPQQKERGKKRRQTQTPAKGAKPKTKGQEQPSASDNNKKGRGRDKRSTREGQKTTHQPPNKHVPHVSLKKQQKHTQKAAGRGRDPSSVKAKH